MLPKRWIVERTLAWISRCRRLARDYERHARKAAAFVRLAMIRLMLRRLAVKPADQESKLPGRALTARERREARRMLGWKPAAPSLGTIRMDYDKTLFAGVEEG